MPEYPDITIYVEALTRRVVGQRLDKVRLANPFLLRTVEPPLTATQGRTVLGVQRLGKRIVFGLEDDLFLVLHLMIAGRLRWRDTGAAIPKKVGLAAFDFATGSAILTEQGTKRRASLAVVRGAEGLAAHDPGGLELFEIDEATFARAIRRENHTLKRTLTDPHLLSGVGNAYSDEILHHARLSPLKLSQSLSDAEVARLFASCKQVLTEWTNTLRTEMGDGFPEHVTAFRPTMAAHGRYGEPCPVCGSKIQRIRYAENETNYCPKCQTEGRLLADRALSRLLKQDWPKSLDEMERGKEERRKRLGSS